MTDVVLLHYNNYFNRIVKKESTVAAYLRADSQATSCANINFVPGDGINTSVILGYGTNPTILNDYDYVVVFDSSTPSHPILSRWFITQCTRTRGGQYKFDLLRDVIADHYDTVVSSPIYLEKGHISSVDNPLLYNKEGLQVNQIKQYEVPLMDESKCGWVVGYVPRDAFSSSTTVNANVPVQEAADITVNNLTEWGYWPYCSSNLTGKSVAEHSSAKKLTLKVKAEVSQAQGSYRYTQGMVGNVAGSDISFTVQRFLNEDYSTWSGLQWTGNHIFNAYVCQKVVADIISHKTINGVLETVLASKLNMVFDDAAYSQLIGQEGKVIKDTTANAYYRIKLKRVSDSTEFTVRTADAGGSALYSNINGDLIKSQLPEGRLSGDLVSGNIFQTAFLGTSYILELEQLTVAASVTIDSNRIHLEDSPYDMFCLPYSDELKMTDGTSTWTCNKALALSIATEIGADAGANAVYDIELLPYCPHRAMLTGASDPSVLLNIANLSYDLITSGSNTIGAIVWCPKSTFSFEIDTLGDLQHCQALEPYSAVPGTSFATEKYYILPSLPASLSHNRTAISTTSYNRIYTYRVDKLTGSIVPSSFQAVNTIEIVKVDDPDTPEVETVPHIKGYTKSGETLTTVFDYTNSTYNNLPYRLMFMIQKGVPYGAQNIADLISMSKEPSLVYYDVNLTTPEDAKITNDCNLYRLSAGNYSASFEFSPAKSKGFSGYVVDCTYKPFNPWIHVIPKLKGLYGDNFVAIDDARGLICGGDYSIAQISNAWANYQLNNKNYQAVFDRQIKNMDVNNNIAKQEQIASLITGSLTGGVAGGATGALAGGIPGAIVGGAVGLGTSIGGGIMDYQNMIARQEEAKSYATDMYNYSLQNIQAIPTALSKTSALVANTRVWPFLEVFSCTDTEKQAYRNKIEYDGMTIMAIGTLNDYEIGNGDKFYRGQLIRIPGLKDDSHVAEQIYSELMKGEYF